MGIPLPVVAHGRLLGGRFGVLQADKEFSLLLLSSRGQKLKGVHSLADISAAGGGNVLPHPVLQDQSPVQPPVEDLHPPVHGGQGVLGGDLFELKDSGPGQHRPEHIEEGILRSGGDQGDLPVLHKLQQRLLLFLVKVLDLVQVKQNSFRGQQGPDVGDNVLDIADGGGGSVEPVEGAVGALGDDVGHRGLSRARGAVEDQVGHVAAFDDPAQQPILPQDMLLPHHLIQGLGPDLIGQRPVCHNKSPRQKM